MSADRGARHPPVGPADAAELATRQGTRATLISLGLLGATAAIQLGVVAASGSVALLADSIHNLTDALTAIPLLIAFRLARRPPTRRYPYGYSRAEDVAGLAIVALIGVSALVAAAEAVDRLLHPQQLTAAGWVLAAGAIGVLGNETVARYRITVGRRIGSAALVADGLHARTDGLASLGVIVAAIGSMVGLERADAVVGLAITVAIVVTLVHAARSVLHRALDGTDEHTLSLIEAVAGAVDGVEHVADARARWSGHRLLAELSVDVDPAIPVSAGHDIAEAVRIALLREVPRLVEATVHVDPHEHPPHHRRTGRPPVG
ncbi:MAG TPA: cation diffusion facilitator family transporter [Actinomycetota bacterium]|nr:cation diffusion facilitator family transporter [Actinomycetota bacterium]